MRVCCEVNPCFWFGQTLQVCVIWLLGRSAGMRGDARENWAQSSSGVVISPCLRANQNQHRGMKMCSWVDAATSTSCTFVRLFVRWVDHVLFHISDSQSLWIRFDRQISSRAVYHFVMNPTTQVILPTSGFSWMTTLANGLNPVGKNI